MDKYRVTFARAARKELQTLEKSLARRIVDVIIPQRLVAACHHTEERMAWLERLPDTVGELQQRWGLTLGPPFEQDMSCSWVAPVQTADGTAAVLKLGMPHMEGADEIEGLRFWNGDPTVRLLAADDDLGAMLLEQCIPGTSLRELPEREQEVVLAGLLRRMWRESDASTIGWAEKDSGDSDEAANSGIRGVHAFRPLAVMLAHWGAETLADTSRWPDKGLVRDGLDLFSELPRTAAAHVLLATDLHAGNVLRAEREPWLVIDPKPFVGDPAYDATQHLFNSRRRLFSDPIGTMRRFAELLEVEYERVRLWMFARAAAEPRDEWDDAELLAFARAIAP